MMPRGSFRFLTVTLCCVALLAAAVPFGHAPLLAVLPVSLSLDAPVVLAFAPARANVRPATAHLARTSTPRAPPLA